MKKYSPYLTMRKERNGVNWYLNDDPKSIASCAQNILFDIKNCPEFWVNRQMHPDEYAALTSNAVMTALMNLIEFRLRNITYVNNCVTEHRRLCVEDGLIGENYAFANFANSVNETYKLYDYLYKTLKLFYNNGDQVFNPISEALNKYSRYIKADVISY